MKTYNIETISQLGPNHCGIYLITNTINGKYYVGQSVDILNRWQQHEYAEAKSLLYEEIKKYGLINFIFRVLEECSPRELDEREYFWINELNTYEDGYNSTQGNISAIQSLLREGCELVKPTPGTVYVIKWEIDHNADHYPFEDYDYIHGTDNPLEIDQLITGIEGH